MCFDQAEQVFSCLDAWCLFDLPSEIEIVPADDAVFDEAIAGLCDFLFFLFSLGVFAWITDSHGAGEAVGEFDFVELLLDSLAQHKVINVAQDEQGFDDLPKGFHGLIQGMLPRIGIQPPENV